MLIFNADIGVISKLSNYQQLIIYLKEFRNLVAYSAQLCTLSVRICLSNLKNTIFLGNIIIASINGQLFKSCPPNFLKKTTLVQTVRDKKGILKFLVLQSFKMDIHFGTNKSQKVDKQIGTERIIFSLAYFKFKSTYYFNKSMQVLTINDLIQSTVGKMQQNKGRT